MDTEDILFEFYKYLDIETFSLIGIVSQQCRKSYNKFAGNTNEFLVLKKFLCDVRKKYKDYNNCFQLSTCAYQNIGYRIVDIYSSDNDDDDNECRNKINAHIEIHGENSILCSGCLAEIAADIKIWMKILHGWVLLNQKCQSHLMVIIYESDMSDTTDIDYYKKIIKIQPSRQQYTLYIDYITSIYESYTNPNVLITMQDD